MRTDTSILRSALVGTLVLILSPVAGQAQEEDAWQSQIELGFNGASGNSSFSVLRTGGRIKYLHTDVAEFELTGLLRYGKNEERVISDDMRSSLKFDWHPQAVFSPFIFVSAARDNIRKIDAKVDGGLGAKWTFLERGNTVVSLSGAGVWNYENFRVEEGSGDDESNGSFRASARLKFDHEFSSGATFQHITFWQPDVQDFGDYGVEMTNSVTTTLLSRLSLSIEHEYLHDEVPPPGVKKDDQKFAVVLRIQM